MDKMVKYSVCLTLLLVSIGVDCRPTVDDDGGDFQIDDRPIGEDGSGIDEVLPETSTPGIDVVEDGDEDVADVSGSGVEDDLSFSGDQMTSGSASGEQDAELETDDSEKHPTTRFTIIRKDNVLSTSTTKLSTPAPTEVFRPDVDHGSGHEEDPEFQLMTDSPDESFSGSGIVTEGRTVEDSTTVSTQPPVPANTTKTPTLPPDIEIKEDLIPVTASKPLHHHHNKTSTSAVTSKATTTEFLPTPVTSPTPDKGFTKAKDKGETTLLASTRTATGVSVHELTTSGGNHSRHHDGRRRRPSHTDAATTVRYEEASAGASEKKDDEKKVSYFAVIAAAVIAAIVFFALGFFISRCKERRGKITMPWKRGNFKIEVKDDPGSGSSAQAYHDKADDSPDSLQTDAETGNSKPAMNGSKDVESTNNLAEIHAKPVNAAQDSVTAAQNDPNTPDKADDGQNTASSNKDSIDALKYMDETDDELDHPSAEAPLLSEDSKTDGERGESDKGDLAAEVLNSVDKNLNAVSETTGLLAENSVKSDGSAAVTSSGDTSPV